MNELQLGAQTQSAPAEFVTADIHVFTVLFFCIKHKKPKPHLLLWGYKFTLGVITLSIYVTAVVLMKSDEMWMSVECCKFNSYVSVLHS